MTSQVSTNNVRLIWEQTDEKTTDMIWEAAIKEDPGLQRVDLFCTHLFLKEISIFNSDYILNLVSKKLNL